MKLTIKKNFDLNQNTLQHRIVLDAIELLKDKQNFTMPEIISMVYLALLHNVCEEDVVDLVFGEDTTKDYWTIFDESIEPAIKEIVGEDETLKSIVYNIAFSVSDYKSREIDMNGKFFYAAQELIKQLSTLDTQKIADIIVSANAIKRDASTEVKQVSQSQDTSEINEKMKNLISQFKTTK